MFLRPTRPSSPLDLQNVAVDPLKMGVDVAMRRSLREGFVNLLVASLKPTLEPRQDIVGKLDDAKTAFSSWDNCMAVTYCK